MSHVGSLCLQVDILSNDDEVQEVVQFVSDNAKRVLNVDTARVIPVSSRLALDAKLAVGDEAAGESPAAELALPLPHMHDLLENLCKIAKGGAHAVTV